MIEYNDNTITCTDVNQLKLKAVWKDITKYEITYNIKEQDSNNYITVYTLSVKEGLWINLYNPELSSTMIFNGWYTDQDCTSDLSSKICVTLNQDFYGIISPVKYQYEILTNTDDKIIEILHEDYSGTLYIGKSIQLPIIRTNKYKFIGWNVYDRGDYLIESLDENTQVYTYDSDDSIVIKAQWLSKECTSNNILIKACYNDIFANDTVLITYNGINIKDLIKSLNIGYPSYGYTFDLSTNNIYFVGNYYCDLTTEISEDFIEKNYDFYLDEEIKHCPIEITYGDDCIDISNDDFYNSFELNYKGTFLPVSTQMIYGTGNALGAMKNINFDLMVDGTSVSIYDCFDVYIINQNHNIKLWFNNGVQRTTELEYLYKPYNHNDLAGFYKVFDTLATGKNYNHAYSNDKDQTQTSYFSLYCDHRHWYSIFYKLFFPKGVLKFKFVGNPEKIVTINGEEKRFVGTVIKTFSVGTKFAGKYDDTKYKNYKVQWYYDDAKWCIAQ